MPNKTAVLAIVLFAFIVVGMFVYAYLKNQEMKVEQTQTPPVTEEEVTTPYDDITRIDAKHFFIDDMHTLSGEILMPTPCDLIETNVIVAESYPEQVTVEFSVINNADFCAQVMTPQRFKVEAKVSENASFRAMFEGRSVDLNLIPAAEGETPDEFEVFIKG